MIYRLLLHKAAPRLPQAPPQMNRGFISDSLKSSGQRSPLIAIEWLRSGSQRSSQQAAHTLFAHVSKGDLMADHDSANHIWTGPTSSWCAMR
jgi:hypothetical protein